MNIDANKLVNGGFPPEEGRALAATLLRRQDVNWDSLRVDVTRCPASLLISAFFNGFLQEISDRRRELLPKARGIDWQLQFGFQRENVTRWMRDFRPAA